MQTLTPPTHRPTAGPAPPLGRPVASWLLALAALALGATAEASVPVIPLPQSVRPAAGAFSLNSSTPLQIALAGDPSAAAAPRVAAQFAASYIADLLHRSHGLALRLRPAAAGSTRAIAFEREASLPAEGYTLTITPERIRIAASTEAGFFYGAVTLWQLVPPGRGPTAIPAVRIEDEPAYRWRGLMLDSARHYQTPKFIKRLLDAMALHKLNVLHWHLTDDQGWRLEIKRYPKLTEVGAYRVPAGRAARADIDPATRAPRLYGGFYTQATVRDIVAYAASRGITIIPEIEMPGHASAALAAYPELGVAPTRLAAVPADWGIYTHLYDVGEPTCQFLENVLAEVIALFPGRYVHVGGDEVKISEWLNSAAVRARLTELGLADATALHGYLVQRMGRFLAAHGRRLVGWDEILEPGLSTEATITSWNGIDGAIKAAKRGNDTVLSPWPTLYFDFRASGAADEPPGRVTLAPLAGVYAFNPEPPGLSAEEARHVLGLQANVWTEHIRLDERVGHAIFPRAAAVAEVGWTARAQRDWHDFLGRLPAAFRAYRLLGVPYSDSDFAVRATRHYDRAAGAVTIALATESGGGEIRYTLDGREPGPDSALYSRPLALATPTTLVATSFSDATPLAGSRHYRLDRADALRRSSHALKLCSDGISLALEVDAPRAAERPIVRLDIMGPCWIYPDVDLGRPRTLRAAVGSVPFNYQIGDDAAKIRLADGRSPAGELEVRLDGCEGPPLVTLPLSPAANRLGVTTLPAVALPARPGAHDLCLRFARPTLDPMWALDWVEVGE